MLASSRKTLARAGLLRGLPRAKRLFSTLSEYEDDIPARPEPCQAAKMTDIGTRSIFDSGHDEFRSAVRAFYDEQVVPFHSEWEEQGEVARELWKAAGDAGILAATMPEEYGGSGADIKYSVVAWEEQSYSGCSGPGFSLHAEIVMPYILNYGTQEQKAAWLPKMASGEWISAIAMTEPGAGSDLQGMKTTALKDGDDYVLNGSKTFITNGWLSDFVIVCAKTDPSLGAKGISLFGVPTSTPGFHKGKKLKKMGLKAQDTAELFFDEMRVPKDCLLGEEGQGFKMLMDELVQERLLVGVTACASAEATFEWTREYVHERRAFNTTVGKMPTTRHKMAELKTQIAVGRAFTDQCIQLHADGRLDASMASMVKYHLSDLQCKVADECVQLHGGWGYMMEYPVCRQYVDARVQRIYAGTNEIMKELIARTI